MAPKKLKTVSLGDLDYLQIDEEGHLYSRGVPIHRVMDYARIATIASIAIAIGSLGQFIVQLGRSIGWWQ
jgi:hypothetical protein